MKTTLDSVLLLRIMPLEKSNGLYRERRVGPASSRCPLQPHSPPRSLMVHCPPTESGSVLMECHLTDFLYFSLTEPQVKIAQSTNVLGLD